MRSFFVGLLITATLIFSCAKSHEGPAARLHEVSRGNYVEHITIGISTVTLPGGYFRYTEKEKTKCPLANKASYIFGKIDRHFRIYDEYIMFFINPKKQNNELSLEKNSGIKKEILNGSATKAEFVRYSLLLYIDQTSVIVSYVYQNDKANNAEQALAWMSSLVDIYK